MGVQASMLYVMCLQTTFAQVHRQQAVSTHFQITFLAKTHGFYYAF